MAEEDKVYEPYGYWKGRPKVLHEYRVPKPPVLSVQSDMSVQEKPTDSAQQGSAERADMDLRLSFARYLNSREQGITKPLTPLRDRWKALTSHPMTLRVIRYGHEFPFNVMVHRRSTVS